MKIFRKNFDSNVGAILCYSDGVMYINRTWKIVFMQERSLKRKDDSPSTIGIEAPLFPSVKSVCELKQDVTDNT